MSLDTAKTSLALCECFAIELPVGINAYFTSYKEDLTFLGQTYQAIPIRRGPVKVNTDLKSDEMEVSFGLAGVTIGDAEYTVEEIVQYRVLQNSKVTLYEVNPEDPTQYEQRYTGWIRGDIGHDDQSIGFTVTSITGRLSEIMIPRVIYSPECPWHIYDEHCGLDADDWDESGAADANSTARLLYDPVFAYANHPEGYWLHAKVLMTSGENSGLSRSVMTHGDGYVKFLIPLPAAIGTGDGFTAWPNCRGRAEVCDGVFDNYANFLGFEYIPNAETLIAG